MERIKIKDLAKDIKISRKEMGRIHGGFMDPEADVQGKSGGTVEDEIAAFVDANPGLLVVNDGWITPPQDGPPPTKQQIIEFNQLIEEFKGTLWDLNAEY